MAVAPSSFSVNAEAAAEAGLGGDQAKISTESRANVWHLWALGVAGVVSGNYFGWNFGLANGTGALLISTFLALLFYLALCLVLVELSTAHPEASAPHVFVYRALGPIGGLLFSVSQALEYVIAPAVICIGIGGYLGGVTGIAGIDPVWWSVTYLIFIGINVLGVGASFWFSLIIAVASIIVLAVFYVGTIVTGGLSNFAANAFDVAATAAAASQDPTVSWFLPSGIIGVFESVPFAIWFFLAIEELPLAVREARNPVKDLPRAMLGGLGTLAVLAFLTLILSAGSPPGAAALAVSPGPLLSSMSAVFNVELAAQLLSIVALIGLIASFHAIMYAYSRQLESVSRDGFFPVWLSRRWKKRNTPVPSLLAGAVIGITSALVAHYVKPAGINLNVGEVLLKTSVAGALFSYLLVSLAYIVLKVSGRVSPRCSDGADASASASASEDVKSEGQGQGTFRPDYFVSWFGIWGAIWCIVFVVGTVVISALGSAGASAGAIDFRVALIVVGVFYVLALAYFAAYGRKRIEANRELMLGMVNRDS